MKRRNRWNLVIILCLTVICFFVVKNIRTVSKITFDCIYFTFVKTLFPYENVFVVEKEKIVIKEPEKKEKKDGKKDENQEKNKWLLYMRN